MMYLAIEPGTKIAKIVDSCFEQGAELGWTLIKACLVFMVGKLFISLINKLVQRILFKRNFDPSVKSFLGSLVNAVLMVLLIVSVVGALGIQTTSFAALLASAGVAVGMALSGNLSNFAGGLIILLFRPYKVGDYVETLGAQGTVKAIQIFHTVLVTVDNKVIHIPNGSMSSGVVTNYSTMEKRRVDLTYGVEYDTDFQKVKQVLEDIFAHDERILNDPAAPQILLSALADSSVNITVRLWVMGADYWGVYFDTNRTVYERFNQEGIGFPFPQVTVHKAEK